MNPRYIFIGFVCLVIFIILRGSMYTVSEKEITIITQFGKPIGEPISKAGLYFKAPLIQEVNRLEKRVVEWDGPATEMPTKDKTYIEIDTFARWKISDPGAYFIAVGNERTAQSRLDDIIGSELRASIARHELIEVVRSDKARTLKESAEKNPSDKSVSNLKPIQRGRIDIEKDVFGAASGKLKSWGIELLDVKLKRVNYNGQVLERIYQRMISERQQISQLFRSEGEGEAARIMGKKERDLREVESTAYKKVQQLQGEADAEATRIYAEAFNTSPQASEFYSFTKTLETYRRILTGNTSLVISTDSELFRLLKKSQQ
jgi:modulator of FtsH protease HflC